MKKFPEGFLWGAASASYQVEGGNENCDWAKAARAGKVPVCGSACDHYHRFEADFDLIKDLGHTAHRLSVEWARIEPEEGVFNEDELQHYVAVLTALRARGITPFVTLWHFTLPVWFADRGGFEADDAPLIFARYCKRVVAALGDYCTHFSTLNEPNVYATHGYLYGAWPPFKRGKLLWKKIGKEDGTSEKTGATASFANFFVYLKVARNLATAHNLAYVAIKKVQPTALVSVVKHVHYFEADTHICNRIKARIMKQLQTYNFMNRVIDSCDEIGLNYYRHTKFGDNKDYLHTDMDWNVYPEGIYGAIMMLHRYRKPIFIAEAGLADADDDLRPLYLTVQIAAVHKAITDGADVRGHMYWSLMDNYEWALGFAKRFGLIAIDFETGERTVRPSAYVYKKIIEQNGLVE
jgi:beta-glucosidase